jgi:hypothetical protein
MQPGIGKKGRGDRRLGASRRPNYLKGFAVKPITAAEILTQRIPTPMATQIW